MPAVPAALGLAAAAAVCRLQQVWSSEAGAVLIGAQLGGSCCCWRGKLVARAHQRAFGAAGVGCSWPILAYPDGAELQAWLLETSKGRHSAEYS